MTRKSAVLYAIKVLEQNQGDTEAIKKLKELVEAMPLIRWTDASIRDRVEQFIDENGRNPTSTDFEQFGMPPHPVIKRVYGINVAQWLKENYPTVRPTEEEILAKYSEDFVREYNRIKPRTCKEYDEKKAPGIVSTVTLRNRMNNITWSGLLHKFGLPSYYCKERVPETRTFKVIISTDVPEFNE